MLFSPAMIRQLHSDIRRRNCRALFLLSFLFLWADFASAQMTATNVATLRKAAGLGSGNVCAYTLEGMVLGVDTNSGTIFFQDGSGTELLILDLQAAKLEPGQKIRLCGTNFAARVNSCLSLGGEPLVDTDHRHPTLERSGTISLRAGRHPILAKWFNWVGPADLGIAYSGPHLAKQKIPDRALWQMDAASAKDAAHQGLNYRCFEGEWEQLPDFNRLIPKKTGVTTNFDVAVRTSVDKAGVEFTGLLEIPEAGDYTFYLSSDDGGQLFIYSLPPNLSIIGSAPLPLPQLISAGQTLPPNRSSVWVETEGAVTFLSRYRDGVELELATGENRMRVQLLNTPSELPWYLLRGRLRVRGICSSIQDTDGQKYAGAIIAVDWQSARVLEVAPQEWSNFREATLGELSRPNFGPNGEIIHLHGRLRAGPAGGWHLEDGTGIAAMELLTPQPMGPDLPVECLARCAREGTNIFLRSAILRSDDQSRHLLTTALQVQQLRPEEAVREYPVELRGVVTSVARSFDSFVIQDSTHAVYVDVPEPMPQTGLRVGDYCQVKGTTHSGEFSPIVALEAVTVLGEGRMPQPILPTHDQLLGGSLDAQYVELRGMVTATQDSYLTLLTSEGTLYVTIDPEPGERWEKFLNAVIRVRGCFFANWDKETHRVILDHPVFRIAAATVSVDVPPPGNLFEAEKVPARDLMHFNVLSDTFRRVKAAGQIVHCSSDMVYLMDGPTGLRCRLTQSVPLAPGDEVEVVGLVELGGASPLLRQAVVRKTGNSALPKPRQISLDLLRNSYDATLVRVEGTLVDLKLRGSDQVLEMQVGLKTFAARLPANQPPPDSWTAGSRLRVTGVFRILDANQTGTHDVNSFELLLNSPADVVVVASPPWWTLGRLLVIVALLLIGLALAFIWINLLRRQVERRTLQLHREISERERTEKSRAIEQERSRIARDLHDDLGSKLTEISMLATTSSGLKIGPEAALDRLGEIAQTSRAMTAALEGVVWVINSRNDTLASLLEYLASVAEEFLDKAGIACRVEFPASVPEQMITAETRHDVLLSVREALNNAVRHGHPTEVVLRLAVSENGFEIRLQDNGCGFDLSGPRGHGLENLQQRMSKLKGSCVIQSSPGSGTIVTLKLPFPREPEKNGSPES
ncbi:MAG TPA: ATP-binding protein [Verrucomicrobiae bacterium]|jgi:signal transduction histidine kinase|nr:ATP-binding protein [Verrucomicrobiae bacterium]